MHAIKKKKIAILIIVISLAFVLIILFQIKNIYSKTDFQDYLIFFKFYGNGKSLINDESNNKYEKMQYEEFIEREEFYFEVLNKNVELRNINLLESVNSKTLVKEKIAPGTKGEFSIILFSNRNLKYQINFKSENEKPYNLKFYIKEENKKYRTLEELQENLKGKIKKGDIQAINIGWEWEYETNDNNSKLQNIQDTLDAIRIQKYNFTINVIGEQM